METGLRVSQHYNRENGPPKRGENQLKASHNSKKAGSRRVSSQRTGDGEEDEAQVWWGSQSGSPLFLCTDISEKMRHMTDGPKVLSVLLPFPCQAQGVLLHPQN